MQAAGIARRLRDNAPMLQLPLAIAVTMFFWGLFISAAPDLEPVYQFVLYMAAMGSSLWVLYEAADLALSPMGGDDDG
jgi:hypothetical protein